MIKSKPQLKGHFIFYTAGACKYMQIIKRILIINSAIRFLEYITNFLRTIFIYVSDNNSHKHKKFKPKRSMGIEVARKFWLSAGFLLLGNSHQQLTTHL